MRIRLLALMLLLLPLQACGYNQIQTLDERAEEQKSNIGVELTRRNQLVPNLVGTVKGAAEFERGTYTDVARARAGLPTEADLLAKQQAAEAAVKSGDVSKMAAADAELTREIGTFIKVAVEAYPQLQATSQFQSLQGELTESENRIGSARRDYNLAVREYNTFIRQFPQVVTARVVSAERKTPYEAPAGSEQAPVVDFSAPRNP